MFSSRKKIINLAVGLILIVPIYFQPDNMKGVMFLTALQRNSECFSFSDIVDETVLKQIYNSTKRLVSVAEFMHMVTNMDKAPEGPPQYLVTSK